MSSTSATAPAPASRGARPYRERNSPTVIMRRMARRVARAYREQMIKENHILLMGQFAVLDEMTGARSRRPDLRDPLERLWRLPASLEVSRPRSSR